jgi:peptidoglycan/xylan/chitin deacetylase (PgdA/CDA1 family)
MAAMSLMGYRGMSMSDLQPYLLGQKEGKVFGITFDDGYENTLLNALPALNRHGFTSTCYIVSGRVGQTNVWDAGQGIAQVPLMDAAQLQQWVDGGQEIGSHTVTHANLQEVSAEIQAQEIQNSRIALETLVRQPGGVRHFCYPYGALNASAVDLVKQSGYSTATTTRRGRVSPSTALDLHLLSRVLVSRTTTWPQLIAKCATGYEDRRAQ